MQQSHRSSAALAIGVDVGGTFIKVGFVDVETGTLAGRPVRLPTPAPPHIELVLDTARTAVELLRSQHPNLRTRSNSAIGVGLPGDVSDGQHTTGVNPDSTWIGAPAKALLENRLDESVVIINDADAAGLAEMKWGAGAGAEGISIVLTFGTGIGSAIFRGSKLLPNTGLGQLPFGGIEVEQTLSAVARERRAIGWQQWAIELNEFIAVVEVVLRPQLLIIGGGASEAKDQFWQYLHAGCRLLPATLGNTAGIIGAALAATEESNAGG